MPQHAPSASRLDPFRPLTSRQGQGLLLLREAGESARKDGCDIWQFAVEIGRLHAAGLSNTDLRHLICEGYLAHALEHTSALGPRRVFRRLRNLALPQRTCFVLTRKGLALASLSQRASVPGGRQRDAMAAVPRWIGDLRQLWWRDRVVKEFRVPAANQQTVLEALEEEGWPTRIDDPLPPTPGIDPKHRLHDTIKALNRHHRHRILRFHGDGGGRGIVWDLVPAQEDA
jgi:hypothetical protein